MKDTGYPLELDLPRGTAHYAGIIDGQPRYGRDGALLDEDVTIPADLPDWYWHGAFLTCPERDGVPGISIHTQFLPPPLCFEAARRHDAERAGIVARLVPVVVQLQMFDEAA